MPGIQINLTVKDDGTAVINKVSGGVQSLEKTTAASAGRMSATFSKLKDNWIGATVAITAATVALKKSFDFAQDSAQFEEDFGRLNQQLLGFDTNARTVVATMKTVSNGQLSLADTSRLASRGLAAGLDPKQLETFVALADVAGDVLGQDLPSAFDTLVRAAATGRGAVLKQLGIFIDLEKETDALAKATGRTTTEIGEQERAMIGLRRITEQAPGVLRAFATEQVSTTDKMTAFTSSLKDARLQLGFLVQAAAITTVGIKDIFAGAAALTPIPLLLQNLGLVDRVDGIDLIADGFENLSLVLERSKVGLDPLDALQKKADATVRPLTTLTEKTLQASSAATIASQAITRESATLDTLVNNVEPALDALQKLQSQQQDLAQQEIALAAQRTQIVEKSQVLLRSLFAPEIPRFDLALEEQLNNAKSKLEELQDQRFDLPLFGGERQRDVLGQQIEDTKRQISELDQAIVPAGVQLRELEDLFSKLEQEAQQSSGQTREAILKEQEKLVPALQAVYTKLEFPLDFVQSQTQELVGRITEGRLAIVDEQQAIIDSQQALVEEGLAIIERGVNAVESQMSQLFNSIEQQSSSTTGKILTDFQALLESVRQAQLEINESLFAGPQGLAAIAGPGGGSSRINAPIQLGPDASFAVGTPFVPRDMRALIHRGEAIIPADQNPFRGRSTGSFSSGGQLRLGNVEASFVVNIQGEGLPRDRESARQFVRDVILPELGVQI